MAVIGGARARQTLKYTYDFDSQGGATGDITLQGEPLPQAAIVWGGVVDVIEAITSGGSATAGISTSQSADDIVADAAVSGAPWSTTGLKAIVPAQAYDSAIKMTADRAPKLVITTADLTAGKFNLFIEYFLSETS